MTHEPFRHSPGVFGWISSIFKNISNVFNWLGDVASGLSWVRWLAPYFYTIDFWTWEAAIEFAKADDWARDTWDAIQERMRWNDWPSALNAFAHELKLLNDDPKGWLSYTLWRLSDQLWWFMNDPRKWVENHLKAHYPELWAFYQNPRLYVLDKLREQHEELYNFALNPLGWIATNIGDVIDEVRWFIRDPYHFVHWYLLKADSPLAPFWADPGEWVVDSLLHWVELAILKDWKAR